MSDLINIKNIKQRLPPPSAPPPTPPVPAGGTGQHQPVQVQEDGARAGRRRGASGDGRDGPQQDEDQEPSLHHQRLHLGGDRPGHQAVRWGTGRLRWTHTLLAGRHKHTRHVVVLQRLYVSNLTFFFLFVCLVRVTHTPPAPQWTLDEDVSREILKEVLKKPQVLNKSLTSLKQVLNKS